MDLPDKYKFKPSDFMDIIYNPKTGEVSINPDACSNLANAKLAEMFRDAVRVSTHDQRSWFIEEASEPRLNTHQALLICVEEIKPKVCKHEAVAYSCDESGLIIKLTCGICQKTMKATWTVSE